MLENWFGKISNGSSSVCEQAMVLWKFSYMLALITAKCIDTLKECFRT